MDEFHKLKVEQDIDVKKKELDLRKQDQEQMVEAQNQQRDVQTNYKTTTGGAGANA